MFRLNAEFTGQPIERIEADSIATAGVHRRRSLNTARRSASSPRPRQWRSTVNSQKPQIQPQARYILPSFIEHSSFRGQGANHTTSCSEERIIFLGVQVDDASANDIMGTVFVLESLIPTAISPCTSTRWRWAHLADGDSRHHAIRGPISRRCVPWPGRLGGCGAAGRRNAAGKRMALPNARVLIHQPSLSGDPGTVLRSEIPGPPRHERDAHPDGNHVGPATPARTPE